MNAQIVLEKVGVRFPNRVLFEDVNWTLYEGMRVALAGRNGSGKSTLLRIMGGHYETTEGKCNFVGGRKPKIGYLDQSLLDTAVLEVLDQKDNSLNPVRFIVDKLVSHEEGVYEEEVEWETKKTLGGLGFSAHQMEAPMSHLSGGWLLRLFIAAALLEKPEVLLLDEPTNHLDISSIQWLEEFLVNEFQGSLILITHDVALQKRTTDSLAILHGGKFFFRTHQKDYLSFKNSLEDEKRIVERTMEAVQKKIDENMDFYERFRAKAQTASRAQSKLKAAEAFGEELNALRDRLERIEGFKYDLRFKFRLQEGCSKFPLSVKNMSFRYSNDGPWILKHVNTDFKKGQKVAIMGDNGTGKTTFLNLIAERLRPTEGEISRGSGAQIGYFGQHQLDELSLDDNLIENLRPKAQGVSVEQLRAWLGAFGFTGDEAANKKAKVLSGGERARLALVRILVAPANVCLLDEPTNHLDVETKELLKNAIKDYEGTVIFVSHDRDFIEGVADRILYLNQNHDLIDHLGDMDSFFAKFPELVRHIEGKAKPSQLSAPAAPKKTSESASLSYEERKRIKNLIRNLEKKIVNTEAEMAKLGHEKESIQKEIDSPSGDKNALYQKLGTVESTVRGKMVEWERMSSELESLQTKYPDIK